MAERERGGPFRGLADLVRRAPPRLSRDGIEHLLWVGGCDAFGLTRRELLWQVGLWLPPKHATRPAARVRRQLELGLDHPYERLRFGNLATGERMLAEYGVLGFAPSGHPLKLVRNALPPGIVMSDRFAERESGSMIEVVGLVVARQRPHTAKGYVFVLMEDEAGMINVIVRPDVYEQYRVAVRGEPMLWVTGKLQKDGGSMNVLAERVEGLRLEGGKVGRLEGVTEEQVAVGGRHSPYQFLRAMRGVAPDSKDWG